MKNRIIEIALIITGALCLMIPAFYNGYPIVFSDTGTYIGSGVELYFPVDRPITYGLFIRATGFNGFSLWATVFIQSLILSYVLYLFMRMVLGGTFRYRTACVIYLILAVMTSAGWVSSMLLADVFTPVGIIIGALMLFGKLNKANLFFLSFIFLLAAAAHFSHILIFSITFFIILVLRKWLMPALLYPKRYFRAIALIGLTLSSIFIMRPSLDRGKYIIFVSVMTCQGITQEYLKEYCGTKHYRLCQYKDSLPNDYACASWFNYSPSSPVARLGGWTNEMNEECSDITYATLTKPKYILLHIQASLKWSFNQLISFTTMAGNVPLLEGTPPLDRVRRHYHAELQQYLSSKQSRNTLTVYYYQWNDILTAVIVISLLLLLYTFIFKRSLYHGAFGYSAALFFIAIILNAWDCGTFSQVNYRYQSRVMWLLPLLACLNAALLFAKTERRKTAETAAESK